MGEIETGGEGIPCYLACSLHDTKDLRDIDIYLRGASQRRVGLVFAAGRDAPLCLGANVVVPLRDLTVGIMALLAQAEREAISRRTREALAVAKARGVRLGNPNGAAALQRAGKDGAPLLAAIAKNADAHAQDLAPVLEAIHAAGHTSLAAELTARGMLTRRGGHWHKSTVINPLARLGSKNGGATCGSPG